MTGLHQDIKISFLPVGHTKFSPDWCFGLFKQKYRKMRIGCLDDIVRAVNESGNPNVAQLVGTQNGDVIVPMFNWSDYFEDVTIKTALKGISHMHHFHLSHLNLEKFLSRTPLMMRKDASIFLNHLHGILHLVTFHLG